MIPLFDASELSGRSGIMWNAKGSAILPSAVLTPDRVDRILGESEALLARALSRS